MGKDDYFRIVYYILTELYGSMFLIYMNRATIRKKRKKCRNIFRAHIKSLKRI